MEKLKLNIKIIDYSIASLKRRFWKNLSIFLIFSFLTAMVFSIFLISFAIKKELFITENSLPEIFVQRVVAGRLIPMDEERVFEVENIAGVQEAFGRIWGYYYFQNAGINFSIVGIDFELESFKKSYTKVVEKYYNLNEKDFMIVGSGVKKTMEENFYKNYFNFVLPNGEFKKVKIIGKFNSNSELENSDTILMPIKLARKILGFEDNEIIDMVVKVPNPLEVQTVARKIKNLFPDCRVITKEDIKASYQNIFDYKSGIFLSLMITSFLAFFILVFEKASSITKEQVREIGILKALGWQVEDILKLKFFESFLVSFFSYVCGFLISYWWVYVMQAPLIRNIFSGYSVLKPEFKLLFVFDGSLFVTIFLAIVPVYIAATIIPSWRAAIIDPEEAIR